MTAATMLVLWTPIPIATPDGTLFGSFSAMPDEVRERALTLPADTCFVLFATESLVGFTTQGRAAAVPRDTGSPLTLEYLRPARGSGSWTLMVGDALLARWYPDDISGDDVRSIAAAVAQALGTRVVEHDAGVDD